MKKLKLLIFVLVWILFNNSGQRAEWFVVYYEDENSIHKCSRDNYLQMTEYFEERQESFSELFIQNCHSIEYFNLIEEYRKQNQLLINK